MPETLDVVVCVKGDTIHQHPQVTKRNRTESKEIKNAGPRSHFRENQRSEAEIRSLAGRNGRDDRVEYVRVLLGDQNQAIGFRLEKFRERVCGC